MDILEIFRKRAVEKCPIWNLKTPRNPRNLNNESGTCFARHTVCQRNYWLCRKTEKVELDKSKVMVLHIFAELDYSTFPIFNFDSQILFQRWQNLWNILTILCLFKCSHLSVISVKTCINEEQGVHNIVFLFLSLDW